MKHMHPNVIYGGSIPYSQVEQKTAECDIFVIAEGFRDEDINLTKYSLSTKASDGLASGAAILTYGPEDAGLTLGNSLRALWHKQDSTLVAEQTAISSIFAFFMSIYSVFVERPECHQE